ncbi:RlpA-like double-psi beta-barrel-protein domain-containing protein-containing protein [Trametes gibbosa]|nr:RlpA-like double-psi beta-barrel-protein domain-containing protein-containing protein [Trametes gibbosa]
MFSSLLSLSLFSLALGATASSHGPAHHRRHEAIAAQVNTTNSTTQLHRRGQTFSNARLTYYDVGLGACGKTNVPSDFIVALNSGSYGGGYPGPNCFRPIEITYNGKVANAVIMDECPGCPSPGGLDLSEGLFSYLAPLSEGVLTASWRYTDEGDDPAPAPSPKPTTSKWVAPTTSEWTPPPTTSKKPHTTSTSIWVPPPTSTWSSSSEVKWTPSSSEKPSTTWTPSSSSTPPYTPSSSSVASSSVAPSISVAPAALTTPTGPDTLAKLNQAVLGLAEIAIAGAQAN